MCLKCMIYAKCSANILGAISHFTTCHVTQTESWKARVFCCAPCFFPVPSHSSLPQPFFPLLTKWTWPWFSEIYLGAARMHQLCWVLQVQTHLMEYLQYQDICILVKKKNVTETWPVSLL